MSFEILKPFGPSIVKVKIPDQVIIEMNKFVDDLSKNDEKMSSLDHGRHLAGNVTQEFRLDVDFMKKIKWAEFLASNVSSWVQEELKKEIKNFQLIKSWVVRQFQNDYNPVHWHSGDISGVGYLKVPSHLGNTSQPDKKTNENGKLQKHIACHVLWYRYLNHDFRKKRENKISIEILNLWLRSK